MFAEENRLRFPVLSDPKLSVIRRYGVEHVGKNIALPSVFILTKDGRIAFVQVARKLWDRPSWPELRAVLQGLVPKR